MYGQRLTWCSSRSSWDGLSLPERIGPRYDLKSFSWCLWCVQGVSTPSSISLHSIFIVVSFPLNGVPRVGACPISPSLQLLGVVVKVEKHGYVRHKALNAIMAAFPSDISVFSVVLFCFSTFPIPWNDLECHYQWQVAHLVLGYIHAEEGSSHDWGGVFPWTGLLAQCGHWHGSPSLLPPTIAP